MLVIFIILAAMQLDSNSLSVVEPLCSSFLIANCEALFARLFLQFDAVAQRNSQ